MPTLVFSKGELKYFFVIKAREIHSKKKAPSLLALYSLTSTLAITIVIVSFIKQFKSLTLGLMMNSYGHVKVQTGHKTISY